MSEWTIEDVTEILIQLDKIKLPFKTYGLEIKQNNKLSLIGKGGFALVFNAKKRIFGKKEYVIKVIGFMDSNICPKSLKSAIELQDKLSMYKDSIVKTYAHKNLMVSVDDKNNVIDAKLCEELPNNKDYITEEGKLFLQFIVMEKLTPIISQNRLGQFKITPYELGVGKELEAIKCIYSVGQSIANEGGKVMHRDIKLDNIFYATKIKAYKLGDFDFAKTNNSGTATTRIYSKGYGAPEVMNNKIIEYNATIDIYSLGVSLFLLLNDFKFPDSDSYCVNIQRQYCSGYIFPKPHYASDKVYNIIKKMCMYNPKDRYQKIEDALYDMEKIIFNNYLSYEKKHSNTQIIIMGICVCAILGLYKIIYNYNINLNITKLDYIFIFLCFIYGTLIIVRKEDIANNISVIVLFYGIFLLIKEEFSWVKLIALILCWISGIISELFSVGILGLKFLGDIYDKLEINKKIVDPSSYKWLLIFFILLLVVCFLNYQIAKSSDCSIEKQNLNNKIYRIIILIGCLGLICFNYQMKMEIGFMSSIRELVGNKIYDEVLTWNLSYVGISGVITWVIKYTREKYLTDKENKKIINEKHPHF